MSRKTRQQLRLAFASLSLYCSSLANRSIDTKQSRLVDRIYELFHGPVKSSSRTQGPHASQMHDLDLTRPHYFDVTFR